MERRAVTGEVGRDGYPALTVLRRGFYLVHFLFQTHALLLSEWIARFPGPWDRYWYLSDGGHFEVLGAYELIRRRVPRIIVCDGSEAADRRLARVEQNSEGITRDRFAVGPGLFDGIAVEDQTERAQAPIMPVGRRHLATTRA